MAPPPAPGLPPDGHVHTEWSWDTAAGSMEQACARASGLGLPSVAFTDHCDFTRWRLGPPPPPEPGSRERLAPARALAFGSDAHQPASVAREFAQAAGLAEAAGCRPGRYPHDLWRRAGMIDGWT